jgi:hypothetical protein
MTDHITRITNITRGETLMAATTAWTSDELNKIGAADELEIALAWGRGSPRTL